MIRVTDYEDGYVCFRCDKCVFIGDMDITGSLKDNCAIDVDVICRICGESTVLYVLKCADPAYAKELNAKLCALRAKRSIGG